MDVFRQVMKGLAKTGSEEGKACLAGILQLLLKEEVLDRQQMKDALQIANRMLCQEKCPLIIGRLLVLYWLLINHGAALMLLQHQSTLLSFCQALGNLRDKS